MHSYYDPMPSDKLMKLFIIQCISSFIAHDYESGVHYLNEIKQTYAEKMSSLNPTLKNLAKEIIQAVDMFNPGGGSYVESQVQQAPSYPQMPQESSTPDQPQAPQETNYVSPDSSVASELQELLRRRREKRRNR